MTKTKITLGLALAFAAAIAFAAPYGAGYGVGYGSCAAEDAGDCSGPGGGYGPGAGYGPGRGRMMGGGHAMGGAGALMTQAERDAHRAQMQSFTSLEQCNAYWTGHRNEMARRAREQGLEIGPGPRSSPCERMAARGFSR